MAKVTRLPPGTTPGPWLGGRGVIMVPQGLKRNAPAPSPATTPDLGDASSRPRTAETGPTPEDGGKERG
jgi:hypothetical protein